MMDTLDQVATRTLFVQPDAVPSVDGPTHRLLTGLGHEVTTLSTLSEALHQMREEPVDLLILEDAPGSDREQQLEQIRALPAGRRPLEVAIFSDRADESNRLQTTGTPRVHLLLKPLHMHGLLQVIRQLDARLASSAI